MYFTESSFVFNYSPTSNKYISKGDNCSKAVNNFAGINYEVDVIKWFDRFWIYGEIVVTSKYKTISLSIFQGEESDTSKHQLFRAEWDEYCQPMNSHPQPHWHITANQSIENTLKELAELDTKSELLKVLEDEKSKIIDVNRIHFSMCEDWISNKSQAVLLNDNNGAKWFQGLLTHIKSQLEHVK